MNRRGDDAGRERNERERHQEIRDDAVAIDPRVLRRGGGNAAEGEEDDSRAEPCEVPAHGRAQFFSVQRQDHDVILMNAATVVQRR